MLAPSRKLKLEWACSSAYGTVPTRAPCRPPAAAPSGGTYAARFCDHAGLSPPSASTGGADPGRVRSLSPRSNSDHGIGGFDQPISPARPAQPTQSYRASAHQPPESSTSSHAHPVESTA